MIILFGSTGDLAKRKILPALFSIFKKGKLEHRVACVGRREISKGEFVEMMLKPYSQDPSFQGFVSKLEYVMAHMDTTGEDFKEKIKNIDDKKEKIVYLSVSSSLFAPSISLLNRAGMIDKKMKIAFEKPFGHDLKSAENLNSILMSSFKEEQVYRVDHYLGKDVVNNILSIRFLNPLLDNSWDNKSIDNVQIVLSEDIGVETRGEYYDSAGAIRDMIQNHILQIMALVGMERPVKMNAQEIHKAKIAFLKKIENVNKKDVIVGQYDKGIVGGAHVPGYREESEVAKDSKTETFVALKTVVKNERWKGVPFYIKTGKRLNEKNSEINLVLKSSSAKERNVISIRIGPKQEGLAIGLNIQDPNLEIRRVGAEFCYKCEFGPNSVEAYERIFSKLFEGDKMLFPKWDEVKESWRFTDSVRKASSLVKLERYPSGSPGPDSAFRLLEKDKRDWVKVDRKLTI